MNIHFHRFEELRTEWRLCKNPAFEQKVIVRQCVHCPKLDEIFTDDYRKVNAGLEEPSLKQSHKLR